MLQSTAEERSQVAKIRKWFHDYWYYYRLPVTIGAVALVIVIFLVKDIVFREKYDFSYVAAARGGYISEELTNAVDAVAAEVAGDFDGNGAVNILPVPIIVSEDGMSQQDMAMQSKFTVMFSDDSIWLMLLNDTYMEFVLSPDTFVTLSDYGIEGGVNEYFVPVSDKVMSAAGTDTQLYAAVKLVPERKADDEEIVAQQALAIDVLRALCAED